MPHSHRNLILWQKAQDLTLEIVKLAARLPNDKVAPVLTRQIIRSVSSIAANIAEGHGRYSLAAHRNHLSIAKGSTCETDGWLDLLRRGGYLDADAERRLHENCEELIRMLTAKILDFERQEGARRTSKVREESGTYQVRERADDDHVVPLDQTGSRF
jgi:four helix bundle protein